ncbi:MAG: hypothetical protein GY811_06870 [Myxococcales bacterium]|nr:hypothetical protein [Myxococcales bacterium]
MTIRLSALCIALLATGCSEGTTPAPTTPPEAVNSATPESTAKPPTRQEEVLVTAKREGRSLHFADGSGNSYSFVSTGVDGSGQLVYRPMTPGMSSSGTYSGGEAADVGVSAEKNTELWTRVKALQGNQALRG